MVGVAARAAGPVVDVEPSQRTGTEWLGLGLNWGAYDNGSSLPAAEAQADGVREVSATPYNLDAPQWAATDERLDFMSPAWARIEIDSIWFCANPCGTDGFDYDFSSPMMLNLYQTLDDAKRRGTLLDIGFFDANQWASPADAGDPGLAKMMADGIQYLVKVRGYTNIRWFDGINELNDYSYTGAEVAKFLRNMKLALAARGLGQEVQIAGPDTAQEGTPCTIGADGCLGWMELHDPSGEYFPATVAGLGELEEIGLWDTHWYPSTAQIEAGAVESELERARADLATYETGVPLVLGEVGTYPTGAPDDAYDLNNTAGHQAEDGLDVADLGVQIARSGTSGASLWCTDSMNYGFDCGMWNIASDPVPRPRFYAWSLLSRFLPAGSTIFSPPSGQAGVRIVAARTDSGGWTIAAVNESTTLVSEVVRFRPSQPGGPPAGELLRKDAWASYAFTPMLGPQGAVNDDFLPVPVAQVPGSLAEGVPVEVPAQAMTVVTTLPGAQAEEDSLLLAVHAGHEYAGAASVRATISHAMYRFQAGDRIEYDVVVDPATPGAGGFDVVATDGSRLSQAPEWGAGMNPSSPDLSADGVGRVHVTVPIPPSFVGKTAVDWQLAAQTAADRSRYSASYADIAVEDAAGTVQLVVYSSGALTGTAVAVTNATASVRESTSPEPLGFEVVNDATPASPPSARVTLTVPRYRIAPGDTLGYDVRVLLQGPPRSGNAAVDDAVANAAPRSFCPAVCVSAYLPSVPYEATPGAPAGGIDVGTTAGGSLDAAGASDRYGSLANPLTLSAESRGNWVHRQVAIPGTLAGQTISTVTLVGGDPEPGARYDVVYDDIVIRDRAGRLEAVLYGGGFPQVAGAVTEAATAMAFPRGVPLTPWGG